MDMVKVSKGLCEAIGIIHDHIPKRYWGYGEQACRDAIELLKKQEEDIQDLRRENHNILTQFHEWAKEQEGR